MIKEFFKTKFDHLHQVFGRNYYRDAVMLGMIVLSAIEAFSMLMMLLFTVRETTDLVPMSYNSIYGVISLGSWFELYLLVGGISIVMAMNLLIAWAYFDKERLISYLLGLCNAVLGTLGIVVILNLLILGGR